MKRKYYEYDTLDNLDSKFNSINININANTSGSGSGSGDIHTDDTNKFEHIDFFNNIKKQKFNVELDVLESKINHIDIYSIDPIDPADPADTIDTIDTINTIKDFNDMKIIIDFIISNTNSKLSFDSIIIMSNNIIENIGKENFILGLYNDNYLQNKIFSQYISLMLYPSYLFQPYVFDDNFINICVDKRHIHLENICVDSNCLFPSWKKKYNYDIDYDFNSINIIHQKICKNFMKKIFDFYEKVYYKYFNIMIGNMLSFVLSNYEINLNPYDNKFNKKLCTEWICGFNEVIVNCRKFIKKYAIKIELEKIDELDKTSLIEKLNQLNKLYVDFFSLPIIINADIKALFTPLKKFYTPKINSEKYIQCIKTNYLINIKQEIEQIFKLKNYINVIIKNSWVSKFCF